MAKCKQCASEISKKSQNKKYCNRKCYGLDTGVPANTWTKAAREKVRKTKIGVARPKAVRRKVVHIIA